MFPPPLSQIRYLLATGKIEEAEIVRYPAAEPFSVAFAPAAAADGPGADDAPDAVGAAAATAVAAGGGGGRGDGAADERLESEAGTREREMQRLLGIARRLSERGLLISVRATLCLQE